MRRILLPLVTLCVILPTGIAMLKNVSESHAQENATETPIYVVPKSGPFAPEEVAVPQSDYIAARARSGHSDASSPSFSHWNDAGAIPPVCAVCHSGMGFRSFHGLDGSAPGLPQSPVPVGGVVDCQTCHNPGLAAITEIAMPSCISHPVDGGEASCMTCHQGRAAGITISRAVADKADDVPHAELGFINPHYATAAATLLGGYGGMGYQYPGKDYSGRFLHARPVSTCTSCHASGKSGDIRIARVSFDGSGDVKKGIRADISTNANRLMTMIADYAAQVVGVPLHYDGSRHPC